MGVIGLWSLLDKIKKETYLSECCGQKLAIDLSSWLLKCGLIAKRPDGPNENFVRYRSIFFRTLNLLSLGIIPVFVKDSRHSPALKRRKRGDVFYSLSQEFQVFLEALGVPVLESPGEAEKMCAELNSLEIVDGCLSEDGDLFVYGAQTVYKGFTTERQVPVTQKYVMADVEKEFNLSRRDLVAFALLSRSDICDGIQGIGEAAFMNLVQELHKNGITDVLGRIQSWRTDEQLKELEKNSEELKTCPKKPHCSNCCHEGNIPDHRKNGCHVCKTLVNCLASADRGTRNCPCPYHAVEAAVIPFRIELKMRKKASTAVCFPSPEVIAEYMDSQTQYESISDLTLKMPDFRKLCEILHEQLSFDVEKTLRYLIPVVIRLHLHGLLANIDLQPSEILHTKTKNKEKLYVVKWNPFTALEGFEQDEALYECDIPEDLLKSKFNDLVIAFDAEKVAQKKSVSPKKRTQGKDCKDDTKQPKLTDFFKVKK